MSDPVEEFAKEIAKQLPVRELYQDAASPAAKETGSVLEDLAKTLHLVLAPLQFTAAFQDRFRKFLDRAVRRVPEEDRISPASQILGPVLEGIRFETADTPIDHMFSELLSRSMDSKRVDEAHPAFPWLIRQLSPDEARLLRLLSEKTYPYVDMMDWNEHTQLFYNRRVLKDELPKGDLQFPANTGFYIEHLNQLGLAHLIGDGNQKPLFCMVDNQRKQTGVERAFKYELTETGRRFVKACVVS